MGAGPIGVLDDPLDRIRETKDETEALRLALERIKNIGAQPNPLQTDRHRNGCYVSGFCLVGGLEEAIPHIQSIIPAAIENLWSKTTYFVGICGRSIFNLSDSGSFLWVLYDSEQTCGYSVG